MKQTGHDAEDLAPVLSLIGMPVEEELLHEGAVHRVLLRDLDVLYDLVQKF